MLADRVQRSFVGREAELARLEDLSARPAMRPSCTSTAMPGLGKSALLAVLLARTGAAGAATVALDCRSIEPTEPGLLDALRERRTAGTREAIAARLGSLGDTVVVALDHFEVFRLMDTWLRQVLVPALDERVRLLLVGREAPRGSLVRLAGTASSTAWRSTRWPTTTPSCSSAAAGTGPTRRGG